MRFHEHIQRCPEKLTPTDRRLLALLLADPAAAALANSPQLARRAGVNPASLTRLSHKLGFEGFADLRARLRAEFLGPEDSAGRLSAALAGVGPEGTLAAVVQQEAQALSGLLRHVTEAQIKAAAALLSQSRQVLIAGEGTAEAVAMVLERKLRRLGRIACFVRPEPRALAEALAPMDPGDAAVVIALRRAPEHYAALIDTARTAGLSTIVIADHVGPLLNPAPDLLLAAPRGPRGARQTLILPTAIVAAMTLALARADDSAAAAPGRYDALLAAMRPAGVRR